jgi:hypothetical protein
MDDTRTGTAPSLWPDIAEIARRLVDRYSDVLDQQVNDGTKVHSMTWDVLQLDQIYGSDTIDPDADHQLLAVLLAEGAFEELVTTNWDGLVEKAHALSCDGSAKQLSIVIEPADIAGSREVRSRLTKVHGCACLCLLDPAKRSLMVATRRELQNWERGHDREPIRELVRTILRERPAIFVGLSVQDWNLQGEILSACKDLVGPLPDVSKVLFAEPELRQAQRTVISHMIGDAAYEADRGAIERQATLGLYSKPLLGSLYVIALRRKLDLIVTAGVGDLTAKWQTFVQQSIGALEQEVCSRFDSLASPSDDSELWRQLARQLPQFVSRFVRLFLKYDIPANHDGYYPLCPESAAELSLRLEREEQPSLTWLMLVIASIHQGKLRALWDVHSATGKSGVFGQFEVQISGRRIAIFVVADSGTGRAKLSMRNHIQLASGQPVAIIYVTGRRPDTPAHAPRHALPYATPSSSPAEIWIQDLAQLHPDSDALLDALKHELLCA